MKVVKMVQRIPKEKQAHKDGAKAMVDIVKNKIKMDQNAGKDPEKIINHLVDYIDLLVQE